jgi:diadenosine tetraphosphate (Ap4A) HIT family hydrolase
MPETAKEIYRRSVDSLRMPAVEEWETFPFDGELRPRELVAPAGEPIREGEGGAECRSCETPDEEYLWTNARWRLKAPKRNGLPVVVILESRTHYCELSDLPDDVAAELGLMLARVERAVLAVGEIGRVHVCRWGDGAEHLHWWFMGRPAGMQQLIGILAAIWDDILPPTPEDVWDANLARVVAVLREGDRVHPEEQLPNG